MVFLYERSGNYLWHGALRLKANMDRSFAPFKLLDYGRHAGSYDRSESENTHVHINISRDWYHSMIEGSSVGPDVIKLKD